MKKAIKRICSGVIILLLIFGITSSAGFLGSKYFVSKLVKWQIQVTKMGGVMGYNDKYTLFSDGRIIYDRREGQREDKIPADALAGIEARLNECDLPHSFSTPLPDLRSGSDQISTSTLIILDEKEYQLPDLFINPLRQISSMRLTADIRPICDGLQNKSFN